MSRAWQSKVGHRDSFCAFGGENFNKQQLEAILGTSALSLLQTSGGGGEECLSAFRGLCLAVRTQSCARAEILVPRNEEGLFFLSFVGVCALAEVGGSFSH